MPTLFAIIAFICGAYAILQVVTSAETIPNKTVWTLLILLLPILGFIIWVVSGPRSQATAKE